MSLHNVILICLFGLVASGLVYSIWPLATGRRARFSLILEPGLLAPLKAFVVVMAAPVLLAQVGLERFVNSPGALVPGLAFATSLVLCFIQGVIVVVGLGLTG